MYGFLSPGTDIHITHSTTWHIKVCPGLIHKDSCSERTVSCSFTPLLSYLKLSQAFVSNVSFQRPKPKHVYAFGSKSLLKFHVVQPLRASLCRAYTAAFVWNWSCYWWLCSQPIRRRRSWLLTKEFFITRI